MSEAPAKAAAPRFFELYSRGEATSDSIEHYIDRWHDRYKGKEKYPPLHKYLGMTREEYEVWLYDPFSLPCILLARQSGKSLADIMAERLEQLRATDRWEDGAIILSLGNWLKARPRH
jgi:hypothetical protein